MKNNTKQGQAMLVAVLSIGGAILGATTVAGLLMLYQIRSTSDAANSAKAIFAADSGLEWSLYAYFNSSTVPALPTALGNGSTIQVTCYDDTGVNVVACTAPSSSVAISEGVSLYSARAFFLDFNSATTTYP
jgi:hypothetical protein